MQGKDLIAWRAAQELRDGNVVNLGIGLPTLLPNHLPEGIRITLQSENGFMGLGPLVDEPLIDLTDAGGKPCGILPGGSYSDSALSFAIMRGGHVDVTVLGGLQVDQEGNVNVSKIGYRIIGCGGFINITQSTKSVIFAGEFTKILDVDDDILLAAEMIDRSLASYAQKRGDLVKRSSSYSAKS